MRSTMNGEISPFASLGARGFPVEDLAGPARNNYINIDSLLELISLSEFLSSSGVSVVPFSDVTRTRCLCAKERPDPVLKYRSNLAASVFSRKAA